MRTISVDGAPGKRGGAQVLLHTQNSYNTVPREQHASPHASKAPAIRVLSSYPQTSKMSRQQDIAPAYSSERRETATATSYAASPRSQPLDVSPSRLRYVGVEPRRRISPQDLLSGRPARRPSPKGFAQAAPIMKPSSSVRALTNDSDGEEFRAPAPAFHPVLQQALLLVEATEIEQRLALSQEETDAFDSILALFSVAREVETVRVAAFEMFHIERASRRALKRQETRERRILGLWCAESFEDAFLSEEVRLLQRREEESQSSFSRSLLRVRSASLRQNAELFFSAPARGLDYSSRTPSPALALAEPDALAPAPPSSQAVDESKGRAHVNASADGLRRARTPVRLAPATARDISTPATPASPSSSLVSRDSVVVGQPYDCYPSRQSPGRQSFSAREADLENRIARQGGFLSRSAQTSRFKTATSRV